MNLCVGQKRQPANNDVEFARENAGPCVQSNGKTDTDTRMKMAMHDTVIAM